MNLDQLFHFHSDIDVWVFDQEHVYKAKVEEIKTIPHGFNSKISSIEMLVTVNTILLDNTLDFITEILTKARNTAHFQMDGDAVERIDSILTAIKL